MIRTILIEDEPIILQGIVEMIDWQSEGFLLLQTFLNGRDALEYIKGKCSSIDLVVTDIKMPGLTGLELVREVTKFSKDIRFIVLTGCDDFQTVKAALNLGSYAYVSKINIFEELPTSLKNFKADFCADDDAKQDQNLHRVVMEFFHNKTVNIKPCEAYRCNPFQAVGVYILNTQSYFARYDEIQDYIQTRFPFCMKFQPTANFFFILLTREAEISRSAEIAAELDTYLDIVAQLNYTVAVGRSGLSLQGCYDSVQDIKELVSKRRLFRNCRVLTYEREFEQEQPPQFREALNAVISAIEVCCYRKALEAVDGWAHLIFAHHTADDSFAKRNCVMLLSILVWKLEEFETSQTESLKHNVVEMALLTATEELYDCFILLAKDIVHVFEQETSRGKSSVEMIRLSKNYIDSHLFSDLSLTKMSTFSSMSVSTYSKEFKKIYKTTFLQYVNARRMQHAYGLLQENNSIAYVSEQLGYSEINSFKRTFKKYFNINPGDVKHEDSKI